MRKYFLIFLTLLTGGLTWNLKSVILADTSLAKELAISQIKITGDEFLVLHNATNSNLQLGNFWLQYFNDFDLTHTGVSNNSAQLPTVWLQPGQDIMLSVGTAANCGPVWTTKLPFTLKDSAGMLQVVNLSQTIGIIGYKPEDQVSWSSKTADPTDIKGVSSTAAAQIYVKNGNTWQAVSTPPGCTANSTNTSPSTNTPDKLSLNNTSPPSILLSESDQAPVPTTKIPAADSGLIAPQISEVLPNPAAPKTDANDEYIELYNPNNKLFDLNGFILKSGNSTTYSYTFPAGQSLQPHEFKAFYASQTNLPLSNSISHVSFASPDGDVLGQSDDYVDAKDDNVWVFAGGLWQWSITPTPNSQNIIGTADVSSTPSSILSPNHATVPSTTASPKTYTGLIISELMPNPKSPQTDAEDEFVELYNPTNKTVNLKDYTIVTGAKENHKYQIKSGSLRPHTYKAFYSGDTSLSLSNALGHAKLLDPSGRGIDKTADYNKAPDDQSWIYANNKWQWTTSPTPSRPNVLTQPIVLGASTTANHSGTTATNSTPNLSNASTTAAQKSTLHPQILAGVGVLALLYALYEYRHDLSNRLYQLRRYRANRRAAREVVKSPDDN